MVLWFDLYQIGYNFDKMKLKQVVWIGASRKVVKCFPIVVRHIIGQALYEAQLGGKHSSTKILKGMEGIVEIVSDYDKDAYRAVYTVKLGDVLYVLHAFQKKSQKGIKTPKKELDLIKVRLQEAKRIHAELAKRGVPK